jgi:hypothetical protein
MLLVVAQRSSKPLLAQPGGFEGLAPSEEVVLFADPAIAELRVDGP